MRQHLRDVLAVEQDAALVRRLEAGEHPQQRGLAATAGTEQREKLPGPDVERQPIHRPDRAELLHHRVDAQQRNVGIAACGSGRDNTASAPVSGKSSAMIRVVHGGRAKAQRVGPTVAVQTGVKATARLTLMQSGRTADGQRSSILRANTRCPMPHWPGRQAAAVAMNAASASRSAARHGQAEFRAPPENVVRKARPFLCHEIAHFRRRQFRPEGRAEIGAAPWRRRVRPQDASHRRRPDAAPDASSRNRQRSRARRPPHRTAPRQNRRPAAAPSRSSAATSDRTASASRPPAPRAAARS